MLKTVLIFLILSILASPGVSFAGTKIYGKWATSRYIADIKFYDVGRGEGATKMFLGACMGDIVMRSDRKYIYRASHKGPGVKEVEIVAYKYEAQDGWIVCLK